MGGAATDEVSSLAPAAPKEAAGTHRRARRPRRRPYTSEPAQAQARSGEALHAVAEGEGPRARRRAGGHRGEQELQREPAVLDLRLAAEGFQTTRWATARCPPRGRPGARPHAKREGRAGGAALLDQERERAGLGEIADIPPFAAWARRVRLSASDTADPGGLGGRGLGGRCEPVFRSLGVRDRPRLLVARNVRRLRGGGAPKALPSEVQSSGSGHRYSPRPTHGCPEPPDAP